jgi:hypothetical protein
LCAAAWSGDGLLRTLRVAYQINPPLDQHEVDDRTVLRREVILIGLGTWIGVGTGTSIPALAASTVDPFAMMTRAANLPTAHYDDYSVVFN